MYIRLYAVGYGIGFYALALVCDSIAMQKGQEQDSHAIVD